MLYRSMPPFSESNLVVAVGTAAESKAVVPRANPWSPEATKIWRMQSMQGYKAKISCAATRSRCNSQTLSHIVNHRPDHSSKEENNDPGRGHSVLLDGLLKATHLGWLAFRVLIWGLVFLRFSTLVPVLENLSGV